MRTTLLLLLAPCSLLLFLSSCGGKNAQMQMPAANFETMTVSTKDVTMTTKYSATIRGRQDIDIMPQVGGTLTKLCVTEGQEVKAGQTLFIIDQVPYQAALNTAEATQKAATAGLATAQLSYDSKKKLFDQQVISDFELQTAYNSLLSAKAQLAQADAQVTNARNSLSYTVVKSPSNGVVGTLPYRQGTGRPQHAPAVDHSVGQHADVRLFLHQRGSDADHDAGERQCRGSRKRHARGEADTG